YPRVDEIAAPLKDPHPFLARLRDEDLVEDRHQLAMVLAANPDAVEAGIVDQLWNPECDAEILPVAIGLQHSEAQPFAVGALVMVPQRIVGVVAGRARKLMPQ